jgi:hypothetical protein
MKGKEDIAVKCAQAGGAAGLLLGLLSALVSWKEGGTEISPFTVVVAIAQVVLWTFGCALAGGGLAYAGMWIAERKLGLGPDDERPDEILQKTSFLRGLMTETQKSYLDITHRVNEAEKHLDAAEKEFSEGAFAPFWDEIEHAANELAAYKNEIEHMRRSVDVYKNEATELAQLAGAAPPLRLPEHDLPDARPVAARFAAVVRKAQTNFQFAVIYEQRKTNQLLHAGFGSLGAAIYSLGESINASFDTLTKALSTRLDKLSADATKHHEMMKDWAARQKQEAEVLDGIQNKDKIAE